MNDFIHEDEKQAAQAEGVRLAEAYKLLFGSPMGAIVLTDLIRQCRVFNAVEGEIGEGKRLIGLYILRMAGVEAKIKNLVGNYGRSE